MAEIVTKQGVKPQQLELECETNNEEVKHSAPQTSVTSSSTCSIPKNGYCLIINNSVNHEQIQLQALIRKKFEFIVTEWSCMNSRKLNEMLKFLKLKGQLRSDQCLLIVFLSNWKNNKDGKKSISFRGFQEVISKSAESMEFTILVVSDMHGLPQQDVPLATMDVSNPKLHQFVIKNGNTKDVNHQSCQLRDFLAMGDDGGVAESDELDHLESTALTTVMDTTKTPVKLQEELKKFISTSLDSSYATEGHEEVGGYSHPEEYVEYSMVFKFWESIQTTTINNVRNHQKGKIRKLSFDLRKRKLACAFNSLITGILTVATFIFLVFGNTNQQYTSYQEFILISFGVVLQLLSMAGSIYTIHILRKKHKAVKFEREIAGELAEIGQRHWRIVEDARKKFESSVSTSDPHKFDTSPNTIKAFKSAFHASTITLACSIRLAATTLRTLGTILRITLIIAIVGSAIFIPFDIIEIVYIMWVIVWKQKESKHVKMFEKFEKCLQEDLDAAQKEIEELGKELKKAAERKRSRNASSYPPIRCDDSRTADETAEYLIDCQQQEIVYS